MSPYTNPWSDAIPAGSDMAGPAPTGIAAQLQRLKLDIEERMADIVVDWQADPIELKAKLGSLGFAKFYNNSLDSSVIKAILVLEVTVTTDAIGNFVIDFSLLAEDWPLATNFIGCPVGHLWYDELTNVVFAFAFESDDTTVTFTVDDEDGSSVTNELIQGRLIFLFSATPV